MYHPIHMTMNISEDTVNINEATNQYFMEAVFENGKKTVEPLLEHIKKIKEELHSQIKEQDTTIKNNKTDNSVKVKEFDPNKFWRNTLFKDFEDSLQKVFGFRRVEIHPYIEKYYSTTKKFESCELNCAVYYVDRFPIEGIVTDKGFYDKTHSVNMEIWISLGLLKNLTSEEILSVLLHEFGHSIDPAVVDINYTETNILSKYITDRKKDINKNEKRFMSKFGFFEILGGVIIISLLVDISKKIITSIKDLFTPKEKRISKQLEKIKNELDKDNNKGKFNRQNYSEAFADNFVRMYGYGPQLVKALKKMTNEQYRYFRSRYNKEIERQKAIFQMTIDCINDVHKTDIHRIRSLINEYKDDIKDPNTPPVVKKQLEEDLLELEKVLDQYLNHKDEFQKRVNNLINDELTKLEEQE